MALTGGLTVLLAILFAAALPVATVLFWNRVDPTSGRASRWRRGAWRGSLLFGTQLSAVILVAVLVNDAGRFYSSWLELLGEHHSVHPAVSVAGNQDEALRSKLALARAQGHGTVVSLKIPSTSRGVGTFAAFVYLPIQYGMPGYEHHTFPVVELIAGSPGTPATWTTSLGIAGVLDAEIKAGRSLPFIAVMPTADVAGGRDTQCVDVVHGPDVERYLTADVRTAITHAYRTSTYRGSWGLMGYSSGGFCATNLAMRHPDMFDASVSIAGYDRPAHDHQTGELFGHNNALRDQNTPTWRATHLPPPNVALLLISSTQDTNTASDAHALAAAAKPPLSVTLLTLSHGGHNFEVWRAEEPVAFAWLSTRLTAPLAPPPIIDNTQPVLVTP